MGNGVGRKGLAGAEVGAADGNEVGVGYGGTVLGEEMGNAVGPASTLLHTASSSSEQSVGSLEAQSLSAMAPQHEYGAGDGHAVQAPSSRSVGYVVLQP